MWNNGLLLTVVNIFSTVFNHDFEVLVYLSPTKGTKTLEILGVP